MVNVTANINFSATFLYFFCENFVLKECNIVRDNNMTHKAFNEIFPFGSSVRCKKLICKNCKMLVAISQDLAVTRASYEIYLILC